MKQKALKEQKERKRGTGFPVLSLYSIAEVVKEAAKMGRNFSKEGFATFGTKKGKGSFRSGAYLNRLAAMKDFGLIETSEGGVSLTDLALKIALPKDEEESKKAAIEAFMSSDIFAKFLEKLRKNEEIKKDFIGSIGVRDFKISPKKQGVFVKSFVESAIFADLAEDQGNSIVIKEFPSETPTPKPSLKEATEQILEKEATKQFSTSVEERGNKWTVNLKIQSDIPIPTGVRQKIQELINLIEESSRDNQE